LAVFAGGDDRRAPTACAAAASREYCALSRLSTAAPPFFSPEKISLWHRRSFPASRNIQMHGSIAVTLAMCGRASFGQRRDSRRHGFMPISNTH